MKKLLLSMAITAGFAGSAFAADLARAPIYKAPPAAVRTSWTGCWIGGGGGYGMYNVDHSQRDPVTGIGLTSNMTAGGRGYVVTGAVGCDYQISDRFLIGAFADFDWTNLRGDYTTSIFGTAVVGQMKQTWGWAAGARVGYLVTPALLTYFNGGFTQARFDAVNLSLVTGPATGLQEPSQTFNGVFVGAGTEYALDFFPGLFWKSEARAAYYQRKDTVPTCVGAGTACTVLAPAVVGIIESRQPTVYTVRSELVYRFNWGGPVVARY